MPGLFGGIRVDPAVLDRLEAEFRAAWGDVVVDRTPAGAVGGHAFRDPGPCFRDSGDRVVGLDGEASFYAGFEAARKSGTAPLTLSADTLTLDIDAVGNAAVLTDTDLHLAADWTGTIPLYYAEWSGGLAFSSHLRALARAIGAEPDPVGILEFLGEGFTLHHRTLFRGIRRLLGGQSLAFRPGRGAVVTEHSGAWAGVEEEYHRLDRAADAAGRALLDVLEALPGGQGDAALMMSAGWDSRTLLACALAEGTPEPLVCYGHGDLASRELRLARQICIDREIPWQARPLDEDLYDMDALQRAFDRTGNVVFPHWHRAGRVLADGGARFVYAGVFGEMLGGRYWLAHASTGIRKAMTLFPALLRRRPGPEPAIDEAADDVAALFRRDSLPRWPLDDGLPTDGVLDAWNGDVLAALDRYRDRGVATANQLAEAYQGEHIGSRYCNVQLLSCRTHGDVALPLANRRLLSVVTRTPIHTRMQNQLNQRIIGSLSPELLRWPTAATLLPAGQPIVLQESSRVVRKGIQGGHWALHFASGGRISAPRLSWPNYEFLRQGTALQRILDGLEADLWDREALRRRVDAVIDGEWRRQLLPFSTEIAKVLTVDFHLR